MKLDFWLCAVGKMERSPKRLCRFDETVKKKIAEDLVRGLF